ncbi:helix-turn-helix domain-containing protein [Paraburkholderia sp. J12]|uniref:IclR family transcriptional regulator domain-containing protein n=1 Tax=Paraburkholderia sp. J12 TaxID=2805432 RepID=UPI002ABE731F|nr:helix-turn-helix domain-containing protein [Paraburkholderia sp. J12]
MPTPQASQTQTDPDQPAAALSGSESIRAVSRALQILREMNAEHVSTIRSLHTRLGLPKSTVFRILQTLKEEGYVSIEPSGNRYQLTAKVRELSAGYTRKTAIVEAGAPIMLAVTKKIKWPLAIGMIDGDAIVIHYSTMPYSPLAVRATTVGKRLGLLEAAMGYTYLAFCSGEEREALLDLLRDASPSRKLANEEAVFSTIEQTQARGYGLRLKNALKDSATLAVPIMRNGEIVAVLAMTTFGNSMTGNFIGKYKPLLDETARMIATSSAV